MDDITITAACPRACTAPPANLESQSSDPAHSAACDCPPGCVCNSRYPGSIFYHAACRARYGAVDAYDAALVHHLDYAADCPAMPAVASLAAAVYTPAFSRLPAARRCPHCGAAFDAAVAAANAAPADWPLDYAGAPLDYASLAAATR